MRDTVLSVTRFFVSVTQLKTVSRIFLYPLEPPQRVQKIIVAGAGSPGPCLLLSDYIVVSNLLTANNKTMDNIR